MEGKKDECTGGEWKCVCTNDGWKGEWTDELKDEWTDDRWKDE